MRKPWQAITVASAFAAAVLAVSTLYAETAQDKRNGNMMVRGGMMGGMGQMMDHCRQMMSGGSARPNEQWKKPNPPDKSTPEKKG